MLGIRKSLNQSLSQKNFIFTALSDGIRLDGREFNDYRDISIELSRDECRSESIVKIGTTRVLCIVSAEIVVPYPDRPTEGILQFSVDISLETEQAGYTSSLLCRMLERSIRDSEAIDTESLCIIAGERVWNVLCDVRVINYGGNVLDGCNLATMSALRAFRKPEVSVSRHDTPGGYSYPVIKLHNTDEREPLPLALHHIPLAITYGIIGIKQHHMKGKKITQIEQNDNSGVIILSDPMDEEETILDGTITFSVNAHRELCAILKPGGISLSTETILSIGSKAIERSIELHSYLNNSIQLLDQSYHETRLERLEILRKLRILQDQYQKSINGELDIKNSDSNNENNNNIEEIEEAGIDIDDPILQYNYNHATVASKSKK